MRPYGSYEYEHIIPRTQCGNLGVLNRFYGTSSTQEADKVDVSSSSEATLGNPMC